MLFLEVFSLPLRGARQARGRSLKREISLLSRVVQLHHRTRVPPPYHSNLDRAAHIFLRRSAEFSEPADEFPDARRSIENLMLHCSAQCQQDFRHECLRSALPTMPTGRDPTTRRSRRSKKPRKTRGARRSAPPENNLAHARPKGPLRSPRSTMSSHRSGETFGRHARAIAKRGSLVARCSSLTSCRGVVLYAFGLHFADVHRSCFGLHFAVLRSASLARSLQNARRDQ